VGCDERAKLYDLENRVQIPGEAEFLSAVQTVLGARSASCPGWLSGLFSTG